MYCSYEVHLTIRCFPMDKIAQKSMIIVGLGDSIDSVNIAIVSLLS